MAEIPQSDPTQSDPAQSDLDQPIPSEAVATWDRWSRHRAFRTFSWPWWVRRGWIFWPLGLVYGFAFATWHASGMNAWGDWPGLALRGCAAGLVIVSAGPLLATGMRRLGLPRTVERVLVILVILAGIALALAADSWVGQYHDMLMAKYKGMAMEVPWFARALSNLLRFSLNGSTLVLVFVAGGFAVFQYLGETRHLGDHAAREELKAVRRARDAADLRLAVLQAQIEPHFLFNTLASVRSLVATEPERAAATIDALADYLRSTLPQLRGDGLEDATLGKQIDICRRYLELMNVRMDGRLRIVIVAPEALRALPFPPLILLSLVENAVKHGIEPKPGPGIVTIRATAQPDGGLEIAVEDDGAGLREGANHGLGLSNIRAQLSDRFGDRGALNIAGRDEGGTRAAIAIAGDLR